MEHAEIPPQAATSRARIMLTRMDDAGYTERIVDVADPALIDPSFKGIAWIDVNGVEDKETIQKVCQVFNLHPVILEDILDVEQRPKIFEMEDKYAFIEFNTFVRVPTTNEVRTLQYSLLFFPNLIITFQQDAGVDLFKVARDRIKLKRNLVVKNGPGYLLYLILDYVVDHYFSVIEDIEFCIDDLEDRVIENPSREDIASLKAIKQSLIYIRKSIWPMREILNRLESMEPPFMNKGMRIYFRNLYEQIITIIDLIETFRDILSTTFDIHLSSQGNRLNVRINNLTIISTIFLPLNFLAGLFGMNWLGPADGASFDVMFSFGFYIVVSSMVAIALLVMVVFKRKKWF
ncbi:MAG: magnesium/cobalt transporter CorA [Candidatus Lokiarchaeota archaeon]|nr:magnesium/cobalt transporter CorA [Candidatus Lokiarchaeota archaeon]